MHRKLLTWMTSATADSRAAGNVSGKGVAVQDTGTNGNSCSATRQIRRSSDIKERRPGMDLIC